MADLPEATGRYVIGSNEDPPRGRFGPHHAGRSPPDSFIELAEPVRLWLQGLSVDDIKTLGEAMDFHERLSEHTRIWVKDLREKEVVEIQAAMEFARSAKTIGRFGRWVVITFVTGFTGAVVASEKVAIAWKWFTGPPR